MPLRRLQGSKAEVRIHNKGAGMVFILSSFSRLHAFSNSRPCTVCESQELVSQPACPAMPSDARHVYREIHVVHFRVAAQVGVCVRVWAEGDGEKAGVAEEARRAQARGGESAKRAVCAVVCGRRGVGRRGKGAVKAKARGARRRGVVAEKNGGVRY